MTPMSWSFVTGRPNALVTCAVWLGIANELEGFAASAILPAWRPDVSGSTPGVVVPLREPAAVLPALDTYEGAEYQRVRVATVDGTVCWAYAWTAAIRGLRLLPTGWGTRPG